MGPMGRAPVLAGTRKDLLMSEHHQGSTVLSPNEAACLEAGSTVSAETGARESLRNTDRRPASREASCRSPISRRSAWSYYVFDQGHRTLQQSGKGQRIWVNGIREAVVLEPRRDAW